MIKGFRFAVDIGGTFTDIIGMNGEGLTFTRKVSSTPDDYSRAVIVGLEEIFSEAGLSGSSLDEVIHGTTVATNAILEGTGAKTGLITTKGFRDVLEIRRFRIPVRWDLRWKKPTPLVDRYLRLEVDERIDAKGEVLRALDVDGAIAVIRKLISYGVEVVAVCLLHSWANPVHELKIKELVRERFPGVLLSVSSDLIPVAKEYERTSETVINAYIMPVMINYLRQLKEGLLKIGVKAPLFCMQSSGGRMGSEASMQKPVHIVEGGPAAGVIGCAYLAKRLGIPNAITLDMGGTTAKASIIEGGQLARCPEYEVGAGISMASRLVSGRGYVLRVPAIDIAEIGAGGGSILWLDAGGVVHAGPRSAGAVPGPACYDMGGEDPTLTDVNLVLGYINPNYLAGGAQKLKADRAYQAIEEKIAKPAGMQTVNAAWAAHLIANSNMTRAIKAVSSERGRDPCNYALFAFGGAGPIHAAGLGHSLRMKKVVVAPAAGLFSALGLLFADIEHYYIQGFLRRFDESVIDDMNRVFETLVHEATLAISKEMGSETEFILGRSLDMRYLGQRWELTIPVPWERIGRAEVRLLAKGFNIEHKKTYGHSAPEEPLEVVSLRVVSRIPTAVPTLPKGLKAKGGEVVTSRSAEVRKAYFGPQYGWLATPILRVERLDDTPRNGPFIIETYDTAIVTPPNCKAATGEWGSIIIDIGG